MGIVPIPTLFVSIGENLLCFDSNNKKRQWVLLYERKIVEIQGTGWF